MKTVTIRFKVENDEDARGARRALNADDVYMVICDLRAKLFRPARKHGYSDERLSAALDAADRTEVDGAHGKLGDGSELVGLLEERFDEILGEYGIDIERDGPG